jgi:integrase
LPIEDTNRASSPEQKARCAKTCVFDKADASKPPLQSPDCPIKVVDATPFRQKGRKYMSKRSGQTGQVFLRNDRWVGRFYVDVPEASKRKRRALVLGMKRELNRSEAKRKLLDIIMQQGVNTPTHLERSLRPPTTFADVADAWELKRLPQLKPSSRYTAPKLIAKYLRPCFGQMDLEDIKTGTVNDWIMDLQGKGLEPKTIHNLWKLFRAIMNWHSQQSDELPRKWYPSLPTIPDVEQRWFTQQEIGWIVNKAEGQYRVLFHLAGSSGMRAGELFGLHVDDLDMDRGVIHVQRSVWRGLEVSPKTRRGYREVWIDSGTVRIIRDHLGSRVSGRLFQTRNGTPLTDHDVLKDVLYPICDRLKLPRGGMHAFRHGRVSHMQQNQVPPDFTKSQVGHSSLRTTSAYTHFSESFKREIVEQLAASWTHSDQLDSVAVEPKRP